MSGVKGMKHVNKRSRNACLNIFRYKVYMLYIARGCIKCRSLTPILYSTIPHTFIYTPPTDVDGCKIYIDALITGRISIADYYEKNGYVSEIVMPPTVETQKVRVSIQGFVDWLLMRGHIDIPLSYRVMFITQGTQFMPRDFIAAVAPLLEKHAEDVDLGSPNNWRRMTLEDENRVGKDNLTLSRNYVEPVRPLAEVPSPSGPAPEGDTSEPAFPDEAEAPAEIEVRRRLYERHADLLTQVTPSGQRPFYARRLLSYKGALLWAGSSWGEHGPWRVTHRDNSRMLAWGISEP